MQALRTGKPEAVAKKSDGKPVMDLFTRCTEDRVCEGPKDYVLRQACHSFLLFHVAATSEDSSSLRPPINSHSCLLHITWPIAILLASCVTSDQMCGK